jgi:prevent-host-death family protein
MKQVMKSAGPLQRLSVSEAKAKLSDALRAAQQAPVVIHSRGRDVAALVGIADLEGFEGRAAGGGQFLEAIARLKGRLGAGAELPIERARLRARDPFGRPGRG